VDGPESIDDHPLISRSDRVLRNNGDGLESLFVRPSGAMALYVAAGDAIVPAIPRHLTASRAHRPQVPGTQQLPLSSSGTLPAGQRYCAQGICETQPVSLHAYVYPGHRRQDEGVIATALRHKAVADG
jgi:hypothetical protein